MSKVGQNFEFIKLVLFLKLYLGGGLVSPNQTVGSSLIPSGSLCRLGK
jgi:hypothetical protein